MFVGLFVFPPSPPLKQATFELVVLRFLPKELRKKFTKGSLDVVMENYELVTSLGKS